MLCREFKKFGVMVDPKAKEKLIQGDLELIKSTVYNLYDYEKAKGVILSTKML